MLKSLEAWILTCLPEPMLVFFKAALYGLIHIETHMLEVNLIFKIHRSIVELEYRFTYLISAYLVVNCAAVRRGREKEET